jgi:hypothetical protein
MAITQRSSTEDDLTGATPPPEPADPRPRYRLTSEALEREEVAVEWVLPEHSDAVEVVVTHTRTLEDPS